MEAQSDDRLDRTDRGKIAGLVTDAGGALSHSAVVGTTNGTKTIKTGDTIRVNGNQRVVQIL